MRIALCLPFLVGGLVGCVQSAENCPGFTQLSGGTSTLTATQLSFTLDVLDMPGSLTFNATDVPLGVLEYSWGINIDVEGDDIRDFEIAAKHFKDSGTERGVTEIATALQTDLWRTQNASGLIVGSASATLAPVDGSTAWRFTFTVDRDEDALLANLGAQSTYVGTTFYTYGSNLNNRCQDSIVIGN